MLDRLGAALRDLCGTNLPSGVTLHQGTVALVVPNLTYHSLVGIMFNMIRQNAASSPAVLIHLLDVLTAVMVCETDQNRRAALRGHADLVWQDGQRSIENSADLAIVGERYALLVRTMTYGVLGTIGAQA